MRTPSSTSERLPASRLTRSHEARGLEVSKQVDDRLPQVICGDLELRLDRGPNLLPALATLQQLPDTRPCRVQGKDVARAQVHQDDLVVDPAGDNILIGYRQEQWEFVWSRHRRVQS